MAAAAYAPRNILLTGGAGFVGSHVCTLLCSKYQHYKARNPERKGRVFCLLTP